MASLAGTTLVWPGSALDHAWALNPRAYRELVPLGWKAGVPFLLLGATLFAAVVGWFRRRLWGWRLAVVLIAAQVIGNTVNLLLGHVAEGVSGVVVAGALLAYLLLPRVITVFREGSSREHPD
jgi:hypothetical protein